MNTTITTTEKTMTMREFLVAVSKAGLDEKLTTFATEQIEKLDARNASRSSATAKKKAETDAPLMQSILNVLCDHPEGLLTSEIAVAIDSTTSKVAALGKKMVEQRLLTSEKVKVPKVGERVKFTLIQTEGETE